MSAKWVRTNESPPSFLPADLSTAHLIDITCFDDPFRKYVDEKTGEIHDGAKYHEQFVDESQT